jgi:CRP-like cAMP-binding protein
MPTPKELVTLALSKGSRLFQFLDEPGQLRLAAAARVEQFKAGQVVFREGDAGDGLYIMLTGQVAVDADDAGTQKRLTVLTDGMFFGEMSELTNQKRSATVTALTDVELLAFERQQVQAIMKDYPKLRAVLGKVGLLRTEDTLKKLMS